MSRISEVSDELKKKVSDYLEKNPNSHIREIAAGLNLPERVVAANSPDAVYVPPEDFFKIWNTAAEWERILFFVDHDDTIVEFEGKLPKGSVMRDNKLLNLHDHGNKEEHHDHEHHHHEEGNVLGGHIYLDDLQEIYLIKNRLYDLDSISIMFYNSGDGLMFGLYGGREEQSRNIIPSIAESFDNLWNEYSVNA